METEAKLDNDEFEDWKKESQNAASGQPDKFDNDSAFVQYEEVKNH